MTSIRDTLAREATEAEMRQDGPPSHMHRTKADGATSHVYTARMPADRLAELKDVAARFGEQPSALIRRWVLEQLDEQHQNQPDLAEVRRTPTTALHPLDALPTFIVLAVIAVFGVSAAAWRRGAFALAYLPFLVARGGVASATLTPREAPPRRCSSPRPRWSSASPAGISRAAQRPKSSHTAYARRLWDVFVALTGVTG